VSPVGWKPSLCTEVEPEDYLTWLLGQHQESARTHVPVNEIVTALEGVYDDVRADAGPSIVALRTLRTSAPWIEASCVAFEDAPDALEVLRLLHPRLPSAGSRARAPTNSFVTSNRSTVATTPDPSAGSTPTATANGGSDFVACSSRVRQFEAWAGAGIVSESDPIAEREETKAKTGQLLRRSSSTPFSERRGRRAAPAPTWVTSHRASTTMARATSSIRPIRGR